MHVEYPSQICGVEVRVSRLKTVNDFSLQPPHSLKITLAMISLSIFVTLALVPFTFAQSDAATQIEAIESHFSAAQLVPNLLATFAPSAYITPSFEGAGDAAPGAKLSQARES